MLFASLAIVSSLATVSVAVVDEPNAAPRYLLSPGREFAFHSESRSDKSEGGTYIVDWKVWTIRRDAEGAWRLVIRCDLKTKEEKSQNPADQNNADTLVWRCRMFDDGRLVDATTMGTVRDPYRLFPRLPGSPGARANGWESTGPDREGVKRHHRLTTDGKDTLVISSRAEGPEDRVYASTHEYRANFDTKRGVVTRVETEDHSDYPKPSLNRGVIELVKVEDRGEKWAIEFGTEADAYFDAIEAYDATEMRATRSGERCKAILEEAKAALEKARTGIKTPVFLDAIGQKITAHDRSVGYQVEQAEDHAVRLGKPAAEWEAKDIDGQPHRLTEYRGKVVVMDFWYRGCGWCMHAMPQINQLSDTFKNDPVAVLGMSIDENEQDARIVVDAMKLRYPTIKAAGIPEKYGVQGYPTLIVIDRQGKVREIHFGYSPRLHEDLSTLIRGLLAEKPTE